MKDSRNYRAVGWSMVAVAASLAMIGLLALAIGNDAYFSDKIMKQKQAEFKIKQEAEEKLKNQVELDTNLKMEEKTGGMLILYKYLE